MTTDDSNTPPGPPDGRDQEGKPFYRRWWFIALGVLVLIGIIASLGGDDEDPDTGAAGTTTSTVAEVTTSVQETTTTSADETTSTAAPVTTATPDTTTTTAAPTTTSTTVQPGPEPVFGPGTQVIGEDAQPGIYETGLLGEGIFEGCYWERLSGFSGDFDEIIANNNAVGHDVVEIMESDAAFDSDCDAWYELTELDQPLEIIPPGKWVVGIHIEAGTYEAEGGDACYWERLSGVSGEFDDLSANDLPGGNAIVEISASDYAFNSYDCGEWTLR